MVADGTAPLRAPPILSRPRVAPAPIAHAPIEHHARARVPGEPADERRVEFVLVTGDDDEPAGG